MENFEAPREIIRAKLLENIAAHRGYKTPKNRSGKLGNNEIFRQGGMDGFTVCKDAPDYMINISGDVRKTKNDFLMKPRLNKDGYPTVHLQVNGKGRQFRIHRLLAIAFLPNPENKPSVNHKDGVKQNNKLSNLEWCTPKENHEHARSVLKVGMFTLTVDQMLINKIQMLVDALEGINKINTNDAVRVRIYRALKKLKEE